MSWRIQRRPCFDSCWWQMWLLMWDSPNNLSSSILEDCYLSWIQCRAGARSDKLPPCLFSTSTQGDFLMRAGRRWGRTTLRDLWYCDFWVIFQIKTVTPGAWFQVLWMYACIYISSGETGKGHPYIYGNTESNWCEIGTRKRDLFCWRSGFCWLGNLKCRWTADRIWMRCTCVLFYLSLWFWEDSPRIFWEDIWDSQIL